MPKKKVVKKIRKKIIILISILLLFVFGLIVILRFFQPEALVIDTYPADFAAGKKVYFYNPKGVYEYNNGKTTQLISANVTSYGYPVLSPNATKIAYFTGKKPYELWLYTISTNETRKLATIFDLYPGYIQTPVWDLGSQNIFISEYKDNKNILYKISLNGKKVKAFTNANNSLLPEYFSYWPQIISLNFLSFNTDIPNGKTLGILDIKNKFVRFFTMHSSAYLYQQVRELSDESFLFIGFPDMSSEGKSDRRGIYGLEKIVFGQGATQYPLPDGLTSIPNFKRVQPAGYCKDYIILGRVTKDNSARSIGESYDSLYVYNLKTGVNQKIADNNKTAISDVRTIYCDFSNGKIYALYKTNGLSGNQLQYTVVDVENPSNVFQYDFTSLLSKDVRESIQENCTYPSLDSKVLGGLPNNVYAFISINPSRLIDEEACMDRKNLVGIYRVEQRKTAEKIASQTPGDIFQQSFLMQPNNSTN